VSAPLLWVAGELVGAATFSLYTLGPGSSVQTYFSFGFSGYALAAHPWLLQLATIAGVYGLSAVAFVLASVGGVWYAAGRWRVGLSAYCLLLIGTSLIMPFPRTYEAREITVGVLEMDWPKLREDVSPRTIDEVKVGAAREGLAALARVDVDQVVMPEDVRLTLYQGGLEGTLSYLTELFGDRVVVVDSGRVDRDGTFSRSFLYDTARQEFHTFDKQYLVPQGEYVPYVYRALLSFLPLGEGTTEALAWTNFEPGRPQALVPLRDNHPAVLFCFESVQPTGVRAAVGERRPPYVAHLVSHAWFSRDPVTLWNQLDAMLKVQAVWNDVPIVQAANNAEVKLYLPTGEIVRPEFVAEGNAWRAGLLTL
jgi:apolipoprotein N-acyltransferase